MRLPRHQHHTWSNIDNYLKETINHTDMSNNTTMPIHEKLSSCFQVEFGFVIFWNWWINVFSLGKFNITNMKNWSNNSENGFLRTRQQGKAERERTIILYSSKKKAGCIHTCGRNTWSFWLIPTISIALRVARYSWASLTSASS